MKTKDDLRIAVYDKMSNEFESFTEKLKKMTPMQVFDKAYEITMKQDILSLFDYEITLSKNDLKILLGLSYPLDAVFQEWLDNDYSHMDMLRDTIDNLLTYHKGESEYSVNTEAVDINDNEDEHNEDLEL